MEQAKAEGLGKAAGSVMLRQAERIAALEDALRRALTIIDCPHYRDIAGMRPNAHPAVDDIRALLDSH